MTTNFQSAQNGGVPPQDATRHCTDCYVAKSGVRVQGCHVDAKRTPQLERHQEIYSDDSRETWAFHYTTDPLVRYLRDRRLRIGLHHIICQTGLELRDIQAWRVLVVCGGVGGEGTFLANIGFNDVTVSDFSEKSLSLCQQFDNRLNVRLLDAEAMDVEADTYDLVLVQDGLHHLPRPTLGLTEMLRVSRKAVLVNEPHTGMVGRFLGKQWERGHGAVNYVFRWNQNMLEQITRSYLLSETAYVRAMRVWDHNLRVGRAARKTPRAAQLAAARWIYAILGTFLPGRGNNMVGVILKDDAPQPARLTSHF